MTLQTFTFIDIFAALIAYLMSRRQYAYVDNEGAIIILFLLFSTLTEMTAEVVYLVYHNKAPVFHFSAVINFVIVSLYFIKTLRLRKERVFIAAVLILLPFLSVANSIWLEPLNKPNTNILVLRSFCIIAMALIALYKILVDEKVKKVTQYPHFYFWGFLLLMHTGTFFFWGLLRVIARQSSEYLPMIQYIQGSINALVYLGMGSAFLLYRKNIAYEWQ